jgi:hypothetical protein
MTTEQSKSPPLTWFEKQYGEITGLSHEEIERNVLSHALSLFDELNFGGPILMIDGPVTQDDDFSVWTGSAHKEFIQLMAYCRGLRNSYSSGGGTGAAMTRS